MNDERDDEQMLAEGRTRFNDETERNDEPEPRVQVLTPSERNAYRGVTIDEKTPDEELGQTNIRFERKTNGWNGFTYIYHGRSWQNKAVLLLGSIALLLFFFFIALPVAFTMLVLSVVSWVLYRLFF